MSGADEDDPFDFSLSPEEMLVTAEEFSLLCVDVGLRNADLQSLAQHLRNGFPLPPEVAAVIADAIDGLLDAPCRIYAEKRRGRERNPLNQTHAHYFEIGMAVERRLKSANRGEYESILRDVANDKRVGRTTVSKAHRYLREWIANASAPEESERE